MSELERSSDDIRDELETALHNWAVELEGDRAMPALSHPAAEILSLIPRVREMVREAPESAETVLWLGLRMGHWQGEPYAYHLRRIQPDAERGEKVRAGASKAGRKRGREQKEASAEQRGRVRARYAELREHRHNIHRSRTALCKQIGREFQLTARTIARYTSDQVQVVDQA
jgi:hypothetical protein